ncbi:MAG: DUF4386 domain-containing protein [Cyclobacteriaceae bacterium]
MNSDKKAVRIAGVLFLVIFILGVTIFQVLQGPVLFADDFLTKTSSHSNQMILSILLGILSGILSIIISIIFLPIFKRYSQRLGYVYISFCILNFIAVSIDNMSVLAMLELSIAYVKNGTDTTPFEIMGTIFYKKHWWTHHLSLLISCFPVFIFYFTLYTSKLIPRAISAIGIIAVMLMFIEMLFTILGQSISMNMLLPIGLIQLFLPFWLIIKGLNLPVLTTRQTE